MSISIIAATGLGLELGKDNKLLWNIPAELEWFKEHTKGKPVVMGRKTFESIGKALPNRTNIVLTSNKDYNTSEDVTVLTDPADVFRFFPPAQEVMIIGGAEIYKMFAPFATKLYVSQVHKYYPEADTHFPALDTSNWNTTYYKENRDEVSGLKYCSTIIEK
jgi:dihydrofolate reductase